MPADWLSAVNDVFTQKQLPPLSDPELSALTHAGDALLSGNVEEVRVFWRNLYSHRARANPLHMRDPWEAIGPAVAVCRDQLAEVSGHDLTDLFAGLDHQLLQDRLTHQSQQIQYLQQLNFHLEYEFEQRTGRLNYFQELHDQARAELYALHELSMYVNASLEEEPVFTATVDGLAGLLDLSYCAIFTQNSDDELELRAGHGLSVQPGYRTPPGGWLPRAVMNSHFVRVDRIASRGDETADLREVAALADSLAIFPLIKGNHTMGVLVIGDRGGSVPLATTDFVNVLAPHIASAIENAKLHQKLNQMAITDGLTGLYNHRYFHDRLQHNIDIARRYMRPFSLLMIDIDHFKQFNDTYGHQAGDRVLRSVAKKLRVTLRGTDIISRYGGEEFAIQLLETANDRAVLVAERLCALFANDPIDLPTAKALVPITVSIGVATFPHDGDTATDLIRFADEGLYAAKHAGRNQVGIANQPALP
ncbi:MAG: sensor domain-containing diguanylate cyclase [Candidatus Sericytochromatia bacterium]|nr:sensor domain-containing diguanylate cyclase [Candidatus Sericytochromatia bacterium]